MDFKDFVNFGRCFAESSFERLVGQWQAYEPHLRKALDTYNFFAEMLPFPLPRIGAPFAQPKLAEPAPPPVTEAPRPVVAVHVPVTGGDVAPAGPAAVASAEPTAAPVDAASASTPAAGLESAPVVAAPAEPVAAEPVAAEPVAAEPVAAPPAEPAEPAAPVEEPAEPAPKVAKPRSRKAPASRKRPSGGKAAKAPGVDYARARAELTQLTRNDLLKKCREVGVEYRQADTKNVLIEALLRHMGAA